MRPRRSALYMPGSNARAIEKARTLPADVIILDLEDSVAPEEKEAARAQVCDAVRSGGFGAREVVIRVNGFDTPYGQADIEAAAAAGPDAILLPKVDRRETLAAVRAQRTSANNTVTQLWAMIETPLAILNLKEIGEAATVSHLPLTCFVLGTNDLIKGTNAKADAARTALISWLSLTVAAAKAFNLTVIDGVYNSLSDEEGFRRECEQGRLLGMDGKTLIHPSQIAVANAAFSPSEDEISEARAIVAAFDMPENAAKGAIRLNGRMVERLHAEMARNIISMARLIEAKSMG